jgi:hypothetical protein
MELFPWQGEESNSNPGAEKNRDGLILDSLTRDNSFWSSNGGSEERPSKKDNIKSLTTSGVRSVTQDSAHKSPKTEGPKKKLFAKRDFHQLELSRSSAKFPGKLRTKKPVLQTSGFDPKNFRGPPQKSPPTPSKSAKDCLAPSQLSRFHTMTQLSTGHSNSHLGNFSHI